MTPSYLKLAALSMDLKRVALAYHNNSVVTAMRFSQESLHKADEMSSNDFPDHIKKILNSMSDILGQQDRQKVAEDTLMYSTILQNAALYNGRNDND